MANVRLFVNVLIVEIMHAILGMRYSYEDIILQQDDIYIYDIFRTVDNKLHVGLFNMVYLVRLARTFSNVGKISFFIEMQIIRGFYHIHGQNRKFIKCKEKAKISSHRRSSRKQSTV